MFKLLRCLPFYEVFHDGFDCFVSEDRSLSAFLEVVGKCLCRFQWVVSRATSVFNCNFKIVCKHNYNYKLQNRLPIKNSKVCASSTSKYSFKIVCNYNYTMESRMESSTQLSTQGSTHSGTQSSTKIQRANKHEIQNK